MLKKKLCSQQNAFSTPVDELPPDAALEEATAAVTGVDAVVFATAGVRTHFAQQAGGQDFTWSRTLTCG